MQVSEKVPILEGTLDVITLLDLMQVLSLGRQFTSIELHSSDGELVGALVMKSGMLLDARTANGKGRDAFFVLLSEPRAEKFNVFRLPGQRTAPNPLGRLDNLVLESMAAAQASSSHPRPVPDAGSQPRTTPHTGKTLAARVPQAPSPSPPQAPTPIGLPPQQPPQPVRVGPSPQPVPPRVAQPARPQPAPSRIQEPPRPQPAPAQPAQARPSPTHADPPIRSAPEAPSPVPRGSRSNRRVLAVSSPKGGVGKTTVALNLGVALAERGVSVLLVDGDPQGGLGHSLTERVRQAPGVREVLEGQRALEDCLIHTRIAKLAILPAGRWPADPRAQELATAETWGRVLDTATRSAEVVLVDTAAGLHSVTTSVLQACDDVLGVVQAEVLGVRSFPALLNIVDSLAAEGRPRLSGVVVNMFQHDQRISHAALHEALRSLPPDLVLQPVIPRDVALLEATASGVPVKFLGDGASTPLTRVFESLATELAMRLSAEQEPQRSAIPFVE